MRDLSALREQVGTWDELAQDAADALALLEMAGRSRMTRRCWPRCAAKPGR